MTAQKKLASGPALSNGLSSAIDFSHFSSIMLCGEFHCHLQEPPVCTSLLHMAAPWPALGPGARPAIREEDCSGSRSWHGSIWAKIKRGIIVLKAVVESQLKSSSSQTLDINPDSPHPLSSFLNHQISPVQARNRKCVWREWKGITPCYLWGTLRWISS